jgi:hypothetical protein
LENEKYAYGNLTSEMTYIENLLPTNPHLLNYYNLLKDKCEEAIKKSSVESIAQGKLSTSIDANSRNFF